MSIYLLINFLKYGIGIVTVGTVLSADLLTDHVRSQKMVACCHVAINIVATPKKDLG